MGKELSEQSNESLMTNTKQQIPCIYCRYLHECIHAPNETEEKRIKEAANCLPYWEHLKSLENKNKE
jgi:hypothetical protein